jgi:flagellar protein FlaG
MAIQVKQATAPAVDDRRRSAVVQSGERPAASGTPVPPGGNASPPQVAEAADLSRAVAALNRFLADSQRSFRFQVDDDSGRTIVRIVNPETGELVRQIPSEDVLAAARALRGAGSLINLRA